MTPGDFARRLLDPLIEGGTLSRERAAQLAAAGGPPLPDRLVAAGVVPPERVLETVGEILAMPAVDLSATYGDPTIADLLPFDKARRLKALPLYAVENELTVALSDPLDLKKLDEIRFITNRWVVPVFALEADIEHHLPLYYDDPEEAEEVVAREEDLSGDISFEAAEPEPEDPALSIDNDEADRPVVRLVNVILKTALADEATDIHLEPRSGDLRVRYRIDGMLQDKAFKIPAHATPGIISRIKVLARLDISERRLPQDGKLNVRFRGRAVDIRVSTFPTIRGEKVVLRLLDKERACYELGTIGMLPPILEPWKRALGHREGILLVTGPTGSGKTSSLYASLQRLHAPEVNIVTLENPVEYELAGISQCQIDTAAGMTFAGGLRAILRQDPDVIMVGEIRDRETAEVAMQAAQTGHLVLATMHTNDAPSAVTRLVDMGIPPFLVASTVRAVLAQRLVRRLCPSCAAPTEPTAEELLTLEPWVADGVPFTDGAGCRQCHGTGYRGRTGVHELLVVERRHRSLITGEGGEDALAAASPDYRPMWTDGVEKVRTGLTSLRELARWIHPEAPPAESPPLRVATFGRGGQS